MQKSDILKEIGTSHPAVIHEVAARHQGSLFDLTCKTCNHVVRNHFIQHSGHRDSLPEHDYCYFQCPKCGVKGNFSHVDSPRPDAKTLAAGVLAQAKASATLAKEEAAAIDAKIAELQKQKKAVLLNALVPENADAKPSKA